MFDRFAAQRPPTARNLPPRSRRSMIGAAALTPALLIGVPGTTHPAPPHDSGLIACTYPLSTQDVPATDYPKIRAQFAGSTGRTCAPPEAHVDLATQLPMRGVPTDTRPSGSTSGCAPARNTTVNGSILQNCYANCCSLARRGPPPGCPRPGPGRVLGIVEGLRGASVAGEDRPVRLSTSSRLPLWCCVLRRVRRQ